jgi:uncharacterized membrane protein
VSVVYALALGIGFVSGLRALTAPAVVAWAVRLGWLNLQGTPLAFMGSTVAVALFSLAALGEFVNDLLPKTPPRTAPAPLFARIVNGGFSGACLCAAAGQSFLTGALHGVAYLVGTGIARATPPPRHPAGLLRPAFATRSVRILGVRTHPRFCAAAMVAPFAA